MVEVFSQPNCNPCRGVKKFLEDKGVDYIERDVTADNDAFDTLVNLGFTGTPVVKTSDDAWQGLNLAKMQALVA